MLIEFFLYGFLGKIQKLNRLKKGQWIRLLNRLNSDLMEEGPLGVEGPKRKNRDAQAREENNIERQKKNKTEEEVSKQCEALTPLVGSAGLRSNPAGSNESPLLELSRAWDPADNSRAWRFSPGTRSYSGVFSRNMAG